MTKQEAASAFSPACQSASGATYWQNIPGTTDEGDVEFAGLQPQRHKAEDLRGSGAETPQLED